MRQDQADERGATLMLRPDGIVDRAKRLAAGLYLPKAAPVNHTLCVS